MDHNPEEIKAVSKAIGRLYGYNTTTMARAVLTALKPFRKAEVSHAIASVLEAGLNAK